VTGRKKASIICVEKLPKIDNRKTEYFFQLALGRSAKGGICFCPKHESALPGFISSIKQRRFFYEGFLFEDAVASPVVGGASVPVG
jgi:hypothetical protein